MKKFNFEKFGFFRNIFFIGFFALFLCFLLFATTLDAHASSNDPNLPYFVDNSSFVNGDGYTFDELSSFAQSRWGGSGMYDFNFYVPGVLAHNYTETINGITYNFTSVYVPIPNGNSSYNTNVTTSNYSSWNYLNSSIEFNFINYYLFVFSNYRNQYNDCYFASNTFYISFFGNTNKYPDYISEYFYVIHDDLPVSNQPILVNSSGSGVSIGHATEPFNDPNNFINGSGNNPIARPTRPTPNPFTPSVWNPPSIDTSTIETLLESIWECLEYGFSYLKDNLSGWFSNLLSNLDSWFGYLVDSVFYAVNKIVQSIQDLATDLYNNFVSLFEPFYDFLSSIVTFFNSLVALGTDENGNFSLTTFIVNLLVPDPDDLASTLLDADMFGIVDLFLAVKTFFTSFFNTIFNLQASKIFTIPSFSAFGITFPSYQMDFSWFDNYKNYSDAIISAFLVIGYAHWFFIQFAPMLRGGGVVAHEQSTDVSKKVGG